jgi:hypothetical protein
MIIDNASLKNVDNHWAVLTIGATKRDRALKVADARLVETAVGLQIQIEFERHDSDDDLLTRLALAYEVAAIEGLHDFLNTTSGNNTLRLQCIAGAWRTFELRRHFLLPERTLDRINHILHISALAYCCDRWSDLRRWFNEKEEYIEIPSSAEAKWDLRMLYKLFDCWIRLFRKKGWDDLDGIREIISGLRDDQKVYESGVLNTDSNIKDKAMAMRLIGLYHWAKCTELLAVYMLQGEPADIKTQLDKHYESATEAAFSSGDSRFEILLKWLHAASHRMIDGSIWWIAYKVDPRINQFVKNSAKHGLFELLPPQRTALVEKGLLDLASTAVVIDLPTSGGKTLLAEFRILQALNQFTEEHGWVAYITPTRALTSQITRRLRRDFEPIGIRVEHLTGAIEIDTFENDLLSAHGTRDFDVLVATPEKLQLIIRNNKVPRPLALIVLDEAHNIENETRGLRIELLLATIKRECRSAHFLLLLPYAENTESLARWLAQDVSAGRSISLGSTPWKPNERIVGVFHHEADDSVRAGWKMKYRTSITTPRAIHLEGEHIVGGVKPLNIAKSRLNLGLETAAMARIMSQKGTSIAVATNIGTVWSMARKVSEELEVISPVSEEISLVQRFLKTEISPSFELIEMLAKGVAVHHAGLSDEVRALVEWLAEEGFLHVLCATTTLAQGMNFPVSSVFLSSRYVPHGTQSKEMPPRDFWNLAGRAGRLDHDSIGVVGLASGDDPILAMEYLNRATGDLVSRLVRMLDQLEIIGSLMNLDTVIKDEQWEDFRCYVAHLWNEKKNLDAVLSETEQLLRNTYGYGMLRSSRDGDKKARALLEATKNYARKLADNPGHVELADMTGFSPEGVAKALIGINQLENKIEPSDWSPESMFGEGKGLANLFGIMLKIPQLADSLTELGGKGNEKKYIAAITQAWVKGESIQDIAKTFFKGDETESITNACRAIYRNLVNYGTWGLAALSRMSGIDFDKLSETERRQINALPAMIYHGVKTEEAVLMRMNSVPRSISENLGQEFRTAFRKDFGKVGVAEAREFLKNLDTTDWNRIKPGVSYLSGDDYRYVWELLSGETTKAK